MKKNAIGLFAVNHYPGESKCPILIFGAGWIGQQLINEYELQYMEYNVMFFVDNDLKKQHSKIKPQVQVNIPHNNIYYNKEIPIISVYEMEDFCKRNPDSIIILAVSEIHQLEIERQLCGIKNTILNFNTFKVLFIREYVDLHIKKYNAELAYQYFKNYYSYVNKNIIKQYQPLVVYLDKGADFVSVASPPKTGNNTMIRILHNKNILATDFHNGYDFLENSYESYWLKLVKEGCKKYIIGIREPISQNISLMFNGIVNMFLFDTDLETNNLDAQFLFDRMIEPLAMGLSCGMNMLERQYEIDHRSEVREHFIQNFFYGSIKNVLGIDVFKIEFNKEKGYGVGVQNGKQVFIYQIEKLENLRVELEEFLQVNEIEIEKVNDGSKKYYAKQYQNFLGKFKMSKEYYHSCYESEYIKKFYSNEDINKFKEKWKNHIR